MNWKNTVRGSSVTMEAWCLFYVAFGSYVLFTTLFSKVSILGATGVGQLLCLMLPACLYAKWKSGSAVKGLRLRRVSSNVLWRISLLALTFIGFGQLLQQVTQPLVEQHFAEFLPLLESLMEILKPKSTAGLVGSLLVVGLIAPFCEEFIFRGAFQGGLEKRGPVRAILMSSFVFAFAHFNPFSFLGILVIGGALGYVTWKTQSLWPAILWHALNNVIAILVLHIGGVSAALPLWVSVLSTIVFLGLAWEFVLHMRSTPIEDSGPLASAPEILSVRSVRVAKVGGLTILLSLFVGMSCFGRARLSSDFLAPDYQEGDLVVFEKGFAFHSEDVMVGDVVMYKDADGWLFCTRVLVTEGEKVTVIGPKDNAGERGEVEIFRNELKGKVIWKFDPGEEVKELMSKRKQQGEMQSTEEVEK